MAFGDFTVVRSTVKRVLGSNGLLQEVAINTPAFEFNADGTYRGLLVEPAGTNLTNYSEQFDNAYWTKTRVNTTGTPPWVDVAVAPDGTTTAEKMIANTDNNTHAIVRTITIATATKHTYSVFAKASEYNFICLLGTSPNQGKFFDLVNGTVLGDYIATPDSATIQNYGNGWYRCSITTTSTSTTTSFQLYNSASGTTTTFTGDDTSGIFIWGAQLETGSVATSYIPTVASTVTRGADSITLASASSLIGQTEGTVYFELEMTNSLGKNVFEITDGTNNNIIQLQITSTYLFGTVKGGVYTLLINPAASALGILKIAIRYKNGDYALYANGSSLGTSANATKFPNGTLTNFIIANSTYSYLNDRYRAVALFPTGLSNAQLASLTTL